MIQDILRRARIGDSDAFSFLYDMTLEKVYRSIFHRVLDTMLTEDIVTIVYMKVIKHIKSFRGTTEGEFFSWILRIAYTTTIDSIKHTGDTDPLEDMLIEPGYTPNMGNTLHDKDTLAKVLSFMKTLPERERTILTMRIWDELSYEEIAFITGESLSNAKKIVSRTLEKITANVSYCILFSLLFSYVI